MKGIGIVSRILNLFSRSQPPVVGHQERTRRKLGQQFPLLILALTTTACGPITKTVVRWQEKPVAQADAKQTKDGVTVEWKMLKETPPELTAVGPACLQNGMPAIQKDGSAVEAKYDLLWADAGEVFDKVVITNGTDHVIRLTHAVLKMFDPAGDAHDLMSKDDAAGVLLSQFACATPVAARIRSLKLLDGNVEILPGMSWSGFVVFAVPERQQHVPGTWKYAFYEIPVALDAAGNVTKTTKFDFSLVNTKFVDTYTAANAFSNFEKTGTEEAK